MLVNFSHTHYTHYTDSYLDWLFVHKYMQVYKQLRQSTHFAWNFCLYHQIIEIFIEQALWTSQIETKWLIFDYVILIWYFGVSVFLCWMLSCRTPPKFLKIPITHVWVWCLGKILLITLSSLTPSASSNTGCVGGMLMWTCNITWNIIN